MAYDLSWLRASDAKALAAAPPGWKRTGFPRVRLIVAASALVVTLAAWLIARAAAVDLSAVGLIALAVTLVSGALAVWALVRRGAEPTLLRLRLTAEANGFTFDPYGLTGLDFELKGAGAELSGGRYFHDAHGTEFGTLSYTTGHDREKQTHSWHYVIATLPAKVPPMLLDARSNDVLVSDLPSSYAKRGRLSLEGDFDKSFRLFAPMAHQQDALYILTPDVMAVLVDDAAAYNIEFLGDRLIFFTEDEPDYERASDWAEVDRLVNTVAAKLADRAVRWAHQL